MRSARPIATTGVCVAVLMGFAASAAGQRRGGWSDPTWTYIYEARLGQDVAATLGNFDELDGTWDDDNPYSLWFGDPITAGGDPGGVEAILRTGEGDNEGGAAAIDAETLAIQDLGNGDPNTRIYFEKFLTDGDNLGAGSPLLDFATGITAITRFRFFSLDDLNNNEGLRRSLGIQASDDAAIAAANTENAGKNEYDEGPREMEGTPNGMFMVSRGDVYAAFPEAGPAGLYWGMDIDGDDSWDPSTFTTPPPALAPVGVKVAFIVRGPSNANAPFQMSDARIVSRLRARGIEVTVLDHDADGHLAYTSGALTGPAAVAADHDLVMISSTVGSSLVGDPNHYKPYNVPVIMWENGLGVPSRGYAIVSTGGLVLEGTSVTVTNNAHPITSHLALGSNAIYAGTTARRISAVGFTLPPAGVALAHFPGQTSFHCLAAWDPTVNGGVMQDNSVLMANQRYVFLPLEDDSFWALNAAGVEIFDRAVEWALGPAKATLLGPRPPVPPAPPEPDAWKPSFYINLGATPLIPAAGATVETRVLKGRFFRDTMSADPQAVALGGDTKVWADLPAGSMHEFVSVYITAAPEAGYAGLLPAAHRVRVYFNGSRCPTIEIQNHHLDPAIVPAVGNGGANDGTGLGMGLWRARAAGYLDVDYFGVRAGVAEPDGLPDVDGDGDVDDADMEVLIDCANGPAVPYSTTDLGCSCLDMDVDGDIDSTDFGEFQICLGDLNTSACAP